MIKNKDETHIDIIELTTARYLRDIPSVLGQDGQNYGRIWTFHDITNYRERRLQRKRALNYSAQYR